MSYIATQSLSMSKCSRMDTYCTLKCPERRFLFNFLAAGSTPRVPLIYESFLDHAFQRNLLYQYTAILH